MISEKGWTRGGQDERWINSTRRRRNHNLFPPATPLILFSGPRSILSRRAQNTFLERLFIAPDFSDEWPRGERRTRFARPISVDSDFQLGPRGPFAGPVRLRFSGRGSRRSGPGSLIKTSIRAERGFERRGCEKPPRGYMYRCYERNKVISVFCVLFWLVPYETWIALFFFYSTGIAVKTLLLYPEEAVRSWKLDERHLFLAVNNSCVWNNYS